MEKEDQQQLRLLSSASCMEEGRADHEEAECWTEDEHDRDDAASPEPPLDRGACDRIEKMAAVVAWGTPNAELFLSRLMFGDRQFDFMYPGHGHYGYYCHRVALLRRRPRLLYS